MRTVHQSGRNIKVLIVENNLSRRVAITRAIHGLNTKIQSALHFERAVELVQKQEYDWIVSQMSLTGGAPTTFDGIQLYSLARKVCSQSTGFVLLADTPSEVSKHWLQVMNNQITQALPMPNIIQNPIDPTALRHALLTIHNVMNQDGGVIQIPVEKWVA